MDAMVSYQAGRSLQRQSLLNTNEKPALAHVKCHATALSQARAIGNGSRFGSLVPWI